MYTISTNYNNNLNDFLILLYNDEKIKELLKNHYTPTIEKSKKFIYDLLNKLLLKSHLNPQNRYILVPQSPNEYTKLKSTNLNKYSYSSMQLGLKILKYYNLIYVQKGKRKNKETKKLKGICTKIYLNDVSKWKVSKETTLHFFTYFNCFPLQTPNYIFIRHNNKQKILKNKELDHSFNKINNFLKEKNLPQLQYKRIFINDLTKGGRYYNSFQFVPSYLRKQLLDFLEWEEIDFKSFNPSICYILEKISYNEDLYEKILKELPIKRQDYFIYRPIIKKLFLCVFGSKSKKQAIKSIQLQLLFTYGLFLSKRYEKQYLNLKNLKLSPFFNYVEEEKIKKQLSTFKSFLKKKNLEKPEEIIFFTPEIIIEAIEKAHTPIKKYFYNQFSLTLQNLESKIITKLMLQQIYHNLLPLSIHDCIIVPKKYSLLFWFYFRFFTYQTIFEYTKDNYYLKELKNLEFNILKLFLFYKKSLSTKFLYKGKILYKKEFYPIEEIISKFALNSQEFSILWEFLYEKNTYPLNPTSIQIPYKFIFFNWKKRIFIPP